MTQIIAKPPVYWQATLNSHTALRLIMRSYHCCHIVIPELPDFKRLFTDLLQEALPTKVLIYQAGQVLFYQGHEPYGVFFLRHGVLMLQSGTVRRAYGQKLVESQAALGLSHIVSATPHCCTATASTEVEVVFIPRRVLEKHLS